MSGDDTGGMLGSEVSDRDQAMGGTFEPDNTGGVSVSDVCNQAMGGISDEEDRGGISGSKVSDRGMLGILEVEEDVSSSEEESNRKRTCCGSQAVATSASPTKKTR